MERKRMGDFGSIIHGGDYNPDQWLDRPEILEEDLQLMKKAHVNCVSLGIFAWSRLEPEEGNYDFEWLAQIIQRLYENDIYTILATPTGAMPQWLTGKYEEVLQVNEYGIRNYPENGIIIVRVHQSCGKRRGRSTYGFQSGSAATPA